MRMKSQTKLNLFSLYRLLALFGVNPRRLFRTTVALPGFVRDYRELKKQSAKSLTKIPFGRFFPALEDRSSEAGAAKGHYFWQDLLVARRVYLNNPKRHVDVGSRIDGFVAHVATFREIEVFDVREMRVSPKNMKFVRKDLLNELESNLVGYTDSLSSLHTLEHIGLGRYGDSLCFDGHLAALDNLVKLLQKGGKFYVSVPFGPQRIEFNAHRVFSLEYFLSLFQNTFDVDEFSYVDDDGSLHEGTTLLGPQVKDNFGCRFGCAILELTKL
jgi:hypothetical protein